MLGLQWWFVGTGIASKDIQTPLYFCKLGCVTALCANISTVENPSN